MISKIEIQHLGKRFKEFEALHDISLSVSKGEFVALVGASGCGKSTLLRIIAGLEARSAGQILVDGRPVYQPGRDRAMVFQDYSLYPWLTVTQNIRFCQTLSVHKKSTQVDVAEATRRSDLLIGLMGLTRVEHAHPNQLSGGMRQRVAIARALMARPEVLLMDEPFGALDTQTREIMHDLILHVNEVERGTILFVTHDVEEAIYLADRVVVMAPNPGRIDSIWPVALGQRNQDRKLEPDFIELKRQITARIRATSGMQTDSGLLRALADTA